MRLRPRCTLAVIAAPLFLGTSAAQDTVPPPPPPPPAEREDQPDAASLKARLERRLAETQQLESRLEAALKRLEEGDSPRDVRESVEPRRRDDDGRPPRLRRFDGGPDHPGPGGPDREAMLDYLDRNGPEQAAWLRKALRENPAMGERILHRLQPHLREVMAERDPEMLELRLAEMRNGWETLGAMRRLTETLRADAKSDDTAAAEARLRELIGIHFDTQVRLRNREVAKLEERLSQVRGELSERLSERDAFVNERLEQMLKAARERASRAPDAPRGGESPRPPKP